MGKADLHIHSYYSPDAFSSPREILAKAREAGLDVIAITDHHTIEGAREAQKIAREFGLEVVIGEEILAKEGEVIGLFIEKAVPPKLSLAEIISRIHEQGGLAIAPHPLSFWQDGLGEELLRRISWQIDGVEIINSGWTGKRNMATLKYLNENFLKLASIGGSDAHFAGIIGKAYTFFDGKNSKDLYAAIKNKSTSAVGDFWSRRDYLFHIGHWFESKSLKNGPLIIFNLLWGVRKIRKIFRRFSR